MSSQTFQRWKWTLVWLAQIAASAVIGLLWAACHGIQPLEGLCSWGLLPLAGLCSAYIATRQGLNNYLAWIAPPLLAGILWLLRWTYLPTPGPVLLTAFCSVVGAAAGEVKNQENSRRKDRHRNGKH